MRPQGVGIWADGANQLGLIVHMGSGKARCPAGMIRLASRLVAVRRSAMRRRRVGDLDHAAGRIGMTSILRQPRGLAVVILAAIWTWLAVVRGSATASVVHVVRPGETLYHIARDYGTTVESLVALNQIDDPNRLRVGQRLLVSATPTIHL